MISVYRNVVQMLKGIILSVEDTILPQGKPDNAIFENITKLITYFKSQSLGFVVLTNREWKFNDNNKTSLETMLKSKWGEFNYYCSAQNSQIPSKPKADAINYVLNAMGWKDTEAIYIGASENDMRTAVNGGLLFLKATWWSNKTNYGFEFDTPKDIARFIDVFCLREHFWCHEIKEGSFDYYSLAPFSTMKPEYTLYSTDARETAKYGRGHPEFWISAIITSLYFSGVHKKIDYICVYPGHQTGDTKNVMDEAISIFGKCFRKNYIPDLIQRHTTAIKSQTARNNNMQICHLNQLNTICLQPKPMKNNTERYKKSPLKHGKRVLLIDDICTRGYSIESGRAYLEKTGAKVVMVTWLKTINTDIQMLDDIGDFDPYSVNTFSTAPVKKIISYSNNMVNHLAPQELQAQFQAYHNWEWKP